MYKSTKTYGHEQGLSCCFRQHAAHHSHCQLLHGYAISVKLEFVSTDLDARNWVMDFGDLGTVKDFLKETFDHTLLVAADDPELDLLCSLQGLNLAKVIVLPRVGCEAFAEFIHDKVSSLIRKGDIGSQNAWVKLKSVEVREHGANSAIYEV